MGIWLRASRDLRHALSSSAWHCIAERAAHTQPPARP